MTKIIAITGKRFSGKSTAATSLELIGYKHLNFADSLREVVSLVYGVTSEEMSDPILKETVLDRYPFRTPREILTILGTEGFRNLIDQQTWVRTFERRAAQHSHVVLSDLRFLNEEQTLNELDALIIRIVNPFRKQMDEISQHRSETEMDSIKPHYTVLNDGSIADLHEKILKIEDMIYDK